MLGHATAGARSISNCPSSASREVDDCCSRGFGLPYGLMDPSVLGRIDNSQIQ